MHVFDATEELVQRYRGFSRSFVEPCDDRIALYLENEDPFRWPEARIALNPNYRLGPTIDELIGRDLLHPECGWIFQDWNDQTDQRVPLRLYEHQAQAVEVAATGGSYVLTTGTGSGKSLGYIIPAVDRALRAHQAGEPDGIRAIVVYPTNALVNSQKGELDKFLRNQRTARKISVKRYTGQERGDERERILRDPPDILLTNYVMLDLLLTRPEERRKLLAAAVGLQMLVLDEMHTYRGRQGADVAFLVRRVREACGAPSLQCVGTSATMTSGGGEAGTSAVATVASRLFGSSVTAGQVIVETLDYATGPIAEPFTEADRARLVDRVQAGAALPGNTEEFARDPLAVWVEHTFGVYEPEPGTRQLARRAPVTIAEAVEQLARLTGCPQYDCDNAIKATLLAGAAITRPWGTRERSVFAFRVHQFLSKGDTVYASLESDRDRYLTLNYQTVVPEAPDKRLYPLAFCRECGQDYLVVHRTEVTYLPGRAPEGATAEGDTEGSPAGQAAAVDGYLYVSADDPWPRDEEQQLTRLPGSWLDGDGIDPLRAKQVPVTDWVQPDGTRVPEGLGLEVAVISGPFTFCLRCGVTYERRGRDFARVGGLSSEGRSSATTILSTYITHALHRQSATPKVLAFTDNRQDAALQAGHFNDFVQNGRLRAALCRAAAAARDGLKNTDVAQAVWDQLGISVGQVAKGDDPVQTTSRQAIEQAIKDVIDYRLHVDLQGGWRMNMPDLEQTGLIRIDFDGLSEVASDQSRWQETHPLLAGASPEQREKICRALLNELRTRLAITAECLQDEGYERIRTASWDWLADAWVLPVEQREIILARVAFPRSRLDYDQMARDVTMSGGSRFGRWLRRKGLPGAHKTMRRQVDDTTELIRILLERLAAERLVYRVTVPRGRGRAETGYQVNAGVLRWRPGSGERREISHVRTEFAERKNIQQGRVNPYFSALYQSGAKELEGLRAAEHTAQVRTDDRQRREELFREDKLPVLYASPTMELGVDIADLDAVLLRNVPPTPANYAQRSGRAGRSGQPALVVTYCTTGSEHDQYYFRRPEQMISGQVTPPRLDLANEDLVRAHVHAIWLAETGLDLKYSLADLLDLSSPTLALDEDVREQIGDPRARVSAIRRVHAALAADTAYLEHATTWYKDGWIESTIEEAAARFDAACNRWRALYRAAVTERDAQRAIADRPTRGKPGRRQEQQRADYAARRASAQIRLLCPDPGDADPSRSDFYSYRYFASEGFLPGYAFPRLPLTAFLPGSDGRDDDHAVLRQRFLALREFGPRRLIYHEGRHFDVVRAVLPVGSGQDAWPLEEHKRCEECGLFYTGEDLGADRCRCDADQLLSLTGRLLAMQAVHTRRRDRITADEEERRQEPFDIETSFAFGLRSHEAEVVGSGGRALAKLTYGDTATIRLTNLGRRDRAKDTLDGFEIDMATGDWLSEKDADAARTDPGSRRTVERVIPYVEDRRNAMVLKPTGREELETMASLQSALRRAVAVEFELEDLELAAIALPDGRKRQSILLYEAAEGGAGVLRRLATESDLLARVATTALDLLHFDADGTDRGGPEGWSERCEKACYDCLLSYTNQLDHQLLDRHAVVDLLRQLSAATVYPDDAEPEPDAQLERLLPYCAPTERELLELLVRLGRRLPTHVHKSVPGTDFTPAFTYEREREGTYAAVFVETGPEEEQAWAVADQTLQGASWQVVRFNAAEPRAA